MDRSSIEAFAKINLYLDVVGRLPSGYHELDTVMQSVSLSDTVTVEKTQGGGITVDCTNGDIPLDCENTAVKAAQSFYNKYNITDANIKITIEKHIPIAAGLAGGSTNAAAVLILLNRIYGTELTVDELCEIGASVGADIPFCIRGGVLRAQGIGDIFSECPKLPSCAFVIAVSNETSQSASAYSELDRVGYVGGDSTSFFEALESGNLLKIAQNMYNAFESIILPKNPNAAKIKGIMDENGALGTLMSGSGPSIFGVYPDRPSAKKVADLLVSEGYRAFVCLPN